MTLDEAAKAYREAYNAGQVATARARAASQAWTDAKAHARSLPSYHGNAWVAANEAREASRMAWVKADKAMRAEWAAKDALALAALDATASAQLPIEAA